MGGRRRWGCRESTGLVRIELRGAVSRKRPTGEDCREDNDCSDDRDDGDYVYGGILRLRRKWQGQSTDPAIKTAAKTRPLPAKANLNGPRVLE